MAEPRDAAAGLRLVGERLGELESNLARWERRRADARAEQEQRRSAFFSAGGACWPCRDTGYLRGDVELGAPCPTCGMGHELLTRLRADWTSEQIRLAGVPRRMQDWSFATVPADARSRARGVQRFVASGDSQVGGHGLLLQGDSSVGKTGLLVAALRQVIERWALQLDDPRAVRAPRAWFVTDVDFLKLVRDGYADGSAREVLHRARTTPLLIIDDLGKADYKDGEGWAAERLFEIINARYNELLPTWYSTNFGAAQLVERLGAMGQALLERIDDASLTLRVAGKKLRGEAQR